LYVAVSLSKCYHQPAGLPSFPTRRSSDLLVCSGLALSVVLALVVATREPYLLVYLDAPIAGMTLADAAAEESTLRGLGWLLAPVDRKSTRLNSSHVKISYAVFCLKKKNKR